ncbi:XRE family transcriptional regulator [Nostoc sp. C057]|uniref:XRE family transcriptional regulator n=1 Tax=Nostoc sp. C057 TaxID=2576903 RepID=UPI0015C33387|nr:XRE family transcriptional regulator [Nostoc sp. C057]QLE51636.1 XRE family transcriptional regulator [Nostoc sp. C057]
MTHSVSRLVAKQPNIGKLIRALRQELNMSKEKLAAEFSIKFLTINPWEMEM